MQCSQSCRRCRCSGFPSHSIIYVDDVRERGTELSRLACDEDLEGIVAKWSEGVYQVGNTTSWLKVKNPDYSQMIGRRELFE